MIYYIRIETLGSVLSLWRMFCSGKQLNYWYSILSLWRFDCRLCWGGSILVLSLLLGKIPKSWYVALISKLWPLGSFHRKPGLFAISLSPDRAWTSSFSAVHLYWNHWSSCLLAAEDVTAFSTHNLGLPSRHSCFGGLPILMSNHSDNPGFLLWLLRSIGLSLSSWVLPVLF